WLRTRLLSLLGIESGESVQQEESFAAWRRFLESIAERSPLVLVIEDIHWADATLVSFVEDLAERMRGVPLFVLCTARPERSELRNSTTIRLGPLTDSETTQLVSALLDRALLPAETQRLLLDRAGGNPLYAEEFVQLLRDRDLLD